MLKEIVFPTDARGKKVKVGDRVHGEDFVRFHDGFKIDRTPVVTVHIKDDVLYFGGLSAASFPKFWIVK
jgi:hypothetical protein